MQLVRFDDAGTPRIGVAVEGRVRVLSGMSSLAELLRLPVGRLRSVVEEAAASGVAVDGPRLLPPVDGLTEVWAAGVTYRRSSEARQEESQVADVYARVYHAVRPELFFKSPAWRVCGDGEPIGIRPDSEIDVPEPELALVCNALGEIVGVTVCDDVSSRSIEGENPLYLPQAKFYSGSCALGPGIVPVWTLPDPSDLAISLTVRRDGAIAWTGDTSTALMHRHFDDLVEHLFRCCSFPDGAVLSTGTGLVPDLSFSLRDGDQVSVRVDGVGTLTNTVRTATTAAFSWLTPDPVRSAR